MCLTWYAITFSCASRVCCIYVYCIVITWKRQSRRCFGVVIRIMTLYKYIYKNVKEATSVDV